MMSMDISRPALHYHGGKWRMARWIIGHFPAHQNYVEPCGGGASVLLQKKPSRLETYNDLDGNVVNFFQVLRDQPQELVRRIHLTPWARAEYETCLEPVADALEAARRYWVSCWMAIGGRGSGWRSITDVRSRHGATWPSDHININHLLQVAERFSRVQIENDDALTCIRRYDNPGALIYFDPPYMVKTRERGGRYRREMTDTDHMAAADALNHCVGFVVVSGYPSEMYRELYEARGWVRQDRKAATNSGGRRTESIWLNPRAWKQF